MVGSRLCHMVAHIHCCGLAVHGEAAKREKKLTFYANKSVDGLQLSKYLADFWKMGYHFDCHIMPHSNHALLYFWGSFFRPFKVL